MGWVLLSAPVFQREWILNDWFASIETQNFPMEDSGFQFEAGPNDDATMHWLMDFYNRHPEVRCFDIVINTQETHDSHLEGQRNWRRERYATMANFRNNLLERAVCKSPDKMFSLDTDILLEDPTTITQLYNLTETLDAVSPLCFMTPVDIEFPNVMTWGHAARGFRKQDYPLGSTFQADVIMAAVMMSKPVYTHARYQYHEQGEDLGWSLHAGSQGFKLYNASNIYSPHIMSRAMLAHYKQYGDPRKRMLENKLSQKVL